VQQNDTILKMTIHSSRVTCFPAYRSSWKQKQYSYRVVQTQVGLDRGFATTKIIVKTSETLIIWSAFYYNARSDRPGRNKGVPDWSSAIMFRVHSTCWVTNIHNQRWMSIMTELYISCSN